MEILKGIYSLGDLNLECCHPEEGVKWVPIIQCLIERLEMIMVIMDMMMNLVEEVGVLVFQEWVEWGCVQDLTRTDLPVDPQNLVEVEDLDRDVVVVVGGGVDVVPISLRADWGTLIRIT